MLENHFKHGVQPARMYILLMFSATSFSKCTHLGLTSETGTLRRAAMSSTVSLPSEMIPTPLAIALAVMGWSPVTMITCRDSQVFTKNMIAKYNNPKMGKI